MVEIPQELVRFHPHALERLVERGAEQQEARETILGGEPFLPSSAGMVSGGTFYSRSSGAESGTLLNS